eukprot:1486173-Rhodomonas_salina.1
MGSRRAAPSESPARGHARTVSIISVVFRLEVSHVTQACPSGSRMGLSKVIRHNDRVTVHGAVSMTPSETW